MAHFSVQLDAENNPILNLPKALAGRRLAILENTEINHPLRALTVKGREMEVALKATLAAMSASEENYLITQKTLGSSVTEAFIQLIYKVTELMDVYAIDLKKSINLDLPRTYKDRVKSYEATVKTARRDWALLCNKIKHNQNMLVPVSSLNIDSGNHIEGFALCGPAGPEKIDINKTFHKDKERFRSYNITLRQIMHDIFYCDYAASVLIRSIPDDSSEILPSRDVVLRIGDSLKIIENRPYWGSRDEISMFDGYSIDKDLTFERYRSIKMHGKFRNSIELVADGFTRTFPLV